MAHKDFYLSLLTSEHRDQPQFAEVVKLLTNALVENVDLGLALIDAFDLDQSQGSQLDAIGLWVGATRKMLSPITGVYFAWELPAPKVAPVLGDTAGGTQAQRTYYVKLSYVYPAGESMPGPQGSRVVPLNSVLTVASPVTGVEPAATGYNVYVSTTSGSETKQNAAPIPIGTGWTEPTTGLIAGSALPTDSVGLNTGWDKGYWQGPFDPSSGVVSVDDGTFRSLIRARIATNMWDGTLAAMYTFWDYVFGPGVIQVQDNLDMSITLIYDSVQINSVMKSLLLQGAFPIKPAGVQVNYVAASGTPIFSWDRNLPKYQGWTGTSVWV